MDNNKTVSASIKQIRVMRGYSQVELSARLGIPPQNYNRIERQNYPAGAKLLKNVADILNVSIAWLQGTAPNLAVYDARADQYFQFPIVYAFDVPGYGMVYTVDNTECGNFMAVILAGGVQITQNDWQFGFAPTTVEEIADVSWVGPHGELTIMLDGLPRLLG